MMLLEALVRRFPLPSLHAAVTIRWSGVASWVNLAT